MTQPFPYVAIVSGVGSVVFANGAGALGDYTINRQFWAPSVAPLRTNRLGGRGRYSETIEELDINVTGSTVAALYANLNTLNLLLDEAERFAAGDPSANPVTLRYAPQGSTVSSTTNFLRALILGRAPGDTSRAALNNPPNFMDAGVTRFAQKVRLRLWRRGRWLAPQAGSSASASTANANLMSITGMTSLGTVSPVARVSLAGFSPSATPTINGGYLALVDDATALLIQNMSGATAAGYTTQNDSGNLPRGGTNVLRYTPAGTAPATSGNITGLAPAPSPARTALAASSRVWCASASCATPTTGTR